MSIHGHVICVLLLLVARFIPSYAQQFNYEVEKRILERLEFYLGGPVATNQLIANFRANGVFRNNMEAVDRDQYLVIAYSVSQPLVYYGLEDGTCPG
jgi:hypothetical protein